MNEIPAEVFSQVYQEQHRKLYAYAFKILKDPERTEDAVQETFKRFISQDYDKIKDHINSWLFTVCRNYSFKQVQKNKRYVELYEFDLKDRSVEDRNPSEELEFQESLKLMDELLENLSDRERTVLNCRFFKFLNYEESAKEMKTSSTNVGYLQSTALSKLREMMKKSLNK